MGPAERYQGIKSWQELLNISCDLRNNTLQLDESALRYLDGVPSYYTEITLPCRDDKIILGIVSGLSSGTPEEKNAFAAGINERSAGTLRVFAGRMAMLGVRKKEPGMLVSGLAAMGLALRHADMETQRYALCEQTQLYHSAEKLGLDPAALFRQAVDLAGRESAGILSFLDRSPRNRSIECMGFSEIAGPCGLVYHAGDSPVPEGLLNDNPVIPPALWEFWETAEISLFYRGLFDIYKPVLQNLHGPEWDRVEGLLWQAFGAGSRDSRVILGLGWLRSGGVTESLRLILDSADPAGWEIRHVDATVALWCIEGNGRSREMLSAILASSGSAYVRRGVVTALREFPGPESDRILKNVLADTDKAVRIEAVYSLLAKHGIPDDRINWPEFMSDLMLGRPEAVVELELQIAANAGDISGCEKTKMI